MTATTAIRRIMTMLGLAVLAAGLCAASVDAEAIYLGLVYDEDPGRAGTVGAANRPVASGELLKTLNEGAVVRLDNGQVIRLAPNSAVRLEHRPSNVVAVTVLSGRVAAVDAEGRVRLAGQQSRFTLMPADRDAAADEARLLELDLVDGKRRRSIEREVPRDGRRR